MDFQDDKEFGEDRQTGGSRKTFSGSQDDPEQQFEVEGDGSAGAADGANESHHESVVDNENGKESVEDRLSEHGICQQERPIPKQNPNDGQSYK